VYTGIQARREASGAPQDARREARVVDPGGTPAYSGDTMLFRKKPKPIAPIVHADDEDFDATVSGHPGVTVVDFWAPWCAPCRMTEPILEEVAIEFEPDGVMLLKVNVDEAPGTADAFGIRSIPTLIFFRAGQPLFEMVGAVPKPVLQREIRTLLSSPEDIAGPIN